MEVSKIKVQQLTKLLSICEDLAYQMGNARQCLGDKNFYRMHELARRLCNQRRYYERLLNYHNNK